MNRRTLQPLLVAVVLASGTLLHGCSRGKDPGPPAPAPEAPETAASLPSPHETKEEVMVATVNGTEITSTELDEAAESMLSQYRDRISPAQMGQMQGEIRKQALESLINQKLLIQQAEQEGIEASKEDVDARLSQVSGRFPDAETFQKALGQTGMSEQDFRREIATNVKIESLLSEKLSGKTDVTEEEIKDFYEENPGNFQVPERVQASHILLKVEEEESAEQRAAKQAEISDLLSQVQKGGDFEQLAQEHSDCPSKSRGGDLGYFERGRMVKPFEEAAFQMKPGDVSDVVETQFGYHIIKVTDRKGAETVSFEQAHDKIAGHLEQQKRERAVNGYLEQLREGAKIEYASSPAP